MSATDDGAREVLARLMHDAVCDCVGGFDGSNHAGQRSEWLEQADAVIAAGWRRPPTDALARLETYEDEWLWREQTDEQLAGWGHHMGQMLHRLPADGQTRDMQASIEAMLVDLRAALSTRPLPDQPDVTAERQVAAIEVVADYWERCAAEHEAQYEHLTSISPRNFKARAFHRTAGTLYREVVGQLRASDLGTHLAAQSNAEARP